MERMAIALGRPRKARAIPDAVIRIGLGPMHRYHELRGNESGLYPPTFSRLLTRGFYFDPQPYREALGYGSGGLDAAIAETVRAYRQR